MLLHNSLASWVMDCMRSYNLLLLALVTGYSIVGGLSACPNDKYIKERGEAAEAVQASLRRVFSNVLKNTTIADDSLSTLEVYEYTAAGVGTFATYSGFVRFQEAMHEVTTAKFDADSRINETNITTHYINKLFNVLNGSESFSSAREAYGELICIDNFLSCTRSSTDRDKSKDKENCTLKDSINDFFCTLNGIRMAAIFGMLDHDPGSLAFVVDNTGSMHDEINTAKMIVNSFIKSERQEPHEYILTTFNDPGIQSQCTSVHCIM